MTTTHSDRLFGRKHILCFGAGIADMFAASAEHIAWLAHHYGIRQVTVDLLSLEITPGQFNIPRNQQLAKLCRNSLLRNAQRLKPPGALTHAKLIADFDIEDYQIEPKFETVGKTTITVFLTDDRGKVWKSTLVSPRLLALKSGFGDPSRK